ncbi:MAG: hypothetical protein IKE27_09255 [Oscillospiraceae bacterium]|nr:hypothetical protein [Oscillospiraceae bacterium]
MIRFGLSSRKHLTGADLYVRIMQIAAVLPAVYILIASGYLYVFAVDGPLSFMFDMGISILPRWAVLILSAVYRKTLSEVLVCFMLTVSALVLGLIMKRLLEEHEGQSKFQRNIRYVLIGLIAADLILRLIPFGFSDQFGTVISVAGAIIRIACLCLLIMDLRAK